MKPLVLERSKVAGLSYAISEDGLELPVVDVTHPACADERSDLDALAARSLPRIEKSGRMPKPLIALMARWSIIARGSVAAKGRFVSAMTTYLMKLGPELLGRGYAGAIDRRLARAISPVCIRRRLRDMARTLAEAIEPGLGDAGRPLVLLNIAGGTAIDSLNALILLRRRNPRLLEGRPVTVRVLDLESAGPTFGARALEALQAPGGALEGVQARFEPVRHDWSDFDGLRRQLGEARPAVLRRRGDGRRALRVRLGRHHLQQPDRAARSRSACRGRGRLLHA
ncbi:MAG: hypothetical protein QM765_39810 [Myxococcales bacterium]